jgi:site-specific recombinase XerD
MNHTLGHIDCPACSQKAFVTSSKLAPEMTFSEAALQWIDSRDFEGGKSGRARFVSTRSLQDFREYERALSRFFGQLPLHKIHLGHLRSYQELRVNGELGPTSEELFPRYAKRYAKTFNVTVEHLQQDLQMMAIVNADLEAFPQREVNPNKVNQEVGMLVRILKRAGCWLNDMEENYEPLQHVESDIPRCLAPEEQEYFLQIASEKNQYVQCFSIVGIHGVLATKEERSLRIADLNMGSGIIMVRVASSKNKYRTRTIPMTDQCFWACERLLERAAGLGAIEPQHYLMPFMSARGQYDPTRPMTVSGIKKPWDEVRRPAGVPWFTPYGLRHTGCTRYAEDGMAIHTLLAMAGHISRKMQQHYIHISDQAKRKAVQSAYARKTQVAGLGRKLPQTIVSTRVFNTAQKPI